MKSINSKINHFQKVDTESQETLWEEALTLFHEGKQKESIKKVAKYLDPKVNIYEENGKLKFELRQGSVKIFVRITDETYYAYINVLSIEYPDPIVYRRLLNLNASTFNNCKASIVKDYIRLTTEALLELASPTRVYWDLYELSTHGDQLDDVLSISSKGVKDMSYVLVESWDQKRQEISIKYIRKWIKQALQKSEYWYRKNDLYVASWWLLGRLFSIVYFVQPEGKLFEEINEINEDYNNQNRNHDENIKRVIIRMNKILNMSDEELKESFFTAYYTFQTNKPISKDILLKYMANSMASADRFRSMGHHESEYISLLYGLGMLINNYSIESEFLELLTDVYEIAHVDFMQEMHPDHLKMLFKGRNRSIFERIKSLFQKSQKNLDITNKKDLKIVTKRIREFYDQVLESA
jgi:hypothetical protein